MNIKQDATNVNTIMFSMYLALNIFVVLSHLAKNFAQYGLVIV